MKPRKRKNRRPEKRRKYHPSMTPTHYVRIRMPRVVIAGDRIWVVVRTKPQRERRVEADLRAAGLDVYSPVTVAEVVSRGKRREVERRPAPGYVFVGTQGLADDLPRVLAVDDAETVLGLPGPPVAVPAPSLQLFSDWLTGDAEGSPPVDLAAFAVGTPVIPAEGPFAELTAVVESVTRPGRVRTLVEIMGRKVPVEFEIQQLRAA